MIVRIVLLVVTGVLIGGILGSVITGDPLYTIVWAVGLPVVIVVAVFFGGRDRPRPSAAAPQRVRGVIRSAGTRPVPTQAVLNPEPTAVPATATAARPRGGSAWGNRALAIVLVLAGVALALIPAYRTIAWTAGNIAQGRWDGNDMRTGLHQQEAVDDLAAVIGSYDVVAVNFFDSYVLVEAPTSVGATTTDQYEWRYGRASRVGPYRGTVDGLFDASVVDFSIIGDLVARARADTGWTGDTAFFPSVRANDAGEPEITVSLNNDYYSASYTFDIQGDLIERYGTGLDGG